MASFDQFHDSDEISVNHLSKDGVIVPIIYEDDTILVINKPVGLIVHGASTVHQLTMSDLLAGIGDFDLTNDFRYPGIVHRLDQFTEGIMVIAKTNDAVHSLKQQFNDRTIVKYYFAVLKGIIVSDSGTIDRPIGRDISVRARKSCHNIVDGTAKHAVTKFRVLKRLTNLTVVKVHLITGRTHQIRVHFASMDAPVFGDALYSRQKERKEGYYLQSCYLEFIHPKTKESMAFTLPVSTRLKKYYKG